MRKRFLRAQKNEHTTYPRVPSRIPGKDMSLCLHSCYNVRATSLFLPSSRPLLSPSFLYVEINIFSQTAQRESTQQIKSKIKSFQRACEFRQLSTLYRNKFVLVVSTWRPQDTVILAKIATVATALYSLLTCSTF